MAHPWGQRPTRLRHRIGPNRLMTWRVAKPLLRRKTPPCGQRGQASGRRARSARTASTRWTVSTRATCHAARINAVREWASSTAPNRRCTAGSSWRMLSCRHSIGYRPPLEPLARESKSVPHFRCYASPPRTERCAPHQPVVLSRVEDVIPVAGDSAKVLNQKKRILNVLDTHLSDAAKTQERWEHAQEL